MRALLVAALVAVLVTAQASVRAQTRERPCFSVGEWGSLALGHLAGEQHTRRQVERQAGVRGTHNPYYDTAYRIAYSYEGCYWRGQPTRMRVSYNRETKLAKVYAWKVVEGDSGGRVGVPVREVSQRR